MRSTLLSVLCLALVSMAAGCFEMTQVVTLNPDGSGKVEFNTLMAAPPQMNMGEEAAKPDMKAMAKQSLQQMVSQSQGVDAWRDLKCDVAKDGRMQIYGVAYFADISKLKLGSMGGDNASWTKNDKGGMVLNLNAKKKDAPKVAPKQMTDQEVQDMVKQQRAQYQQSKPMMASILGTMKMDVTYMLPGKIETTGCFTKTDKGGVQMVIEGKRMLEAMDKMMADDKAMAESIKSGKNMMKDGPGDDKFGEMLVGKAGAPVATVSGDLKPLFEYKAEMEKAKAAQDAMFKKLEIDPKAKKPGMMGGEE